MGRDPLLVWYARHERILEQAELDAILDRVRQTGERERMVAASAHFWRQQAYARRAQGRHPQRSRLAGVHPSVLARWRRWRFGR